MTVKVLTGLGLIIVFLGAMLVDILAAASLPALVIGTFLIGAAAHEFFAMARAAGATPFASAGVVAAMVAFNLPWLLERYPVPNGCGAFIALVVLATFLGLLCRKSRQNALTDGAVTVLGAVYTGLLGGYMVQMHALAAGARLVLYFVAVSKAADIGGYLTGRFLGKHRLAPGISPNKTIEGSVGGMLLSVTVAFALSFLLPVAVSTAWKILFAVLVNAAAQFGDLAESTMKRSCHVKDSAVFLPKVCGALDLIDSVLISAPVAFYLVAEVV